MTHPTVIPQQMQTAKGRLKEKELANEIVHNTDESISCYVPTGSGNMSYPQPDLLLTTNGQNRAIELKTTAQDKFTVPSDEIDQLEDCVNLTTDAYIAVDFNNRQLLMARLADNMMIKNDSLDARSHITEISTPACFNPRIGPSGSYIIDKPSTEVWSSKRSGKPNWEVVIDAINERNHIDRQSDG